MSKIKYSHPILQKHGKFYTNLLLFLPSNFRRISQYTIHPILFRPTHNIIQRSKECLRYKYISFNSIYINKNTQHLIFKISTKFQLNYCIHVYLKISFTSSLHIVLFSFELSLQLLLERIKVGLNT